jgi:hypothetical protein
LKRLREARKREQAERANLLGTSTTKPILGRISNERNDDGDDDDDTPTGYGDSRFNANEDGEDEDETELRTALSERVSCVHMFNLTVFPDKSQLVEDPYVYQEALSKETDVPQPEDDDDDDTDAGAALSFVQFPGWDGLYYPSIPSSLGSQDNVRKVEGRLRREALRTDVANATLDHTGMTLVHLQGRVKDPDANPMKGRLMSGTGEVLDNAGHLKVCEHPLEKQSMRPTSVPRSDNFKSVIVRPQKGVSFSSVRPLVFPFPPFPSFPPPPIPFLPHSLP